MVAKFRRRQYKPARLTKNNLKRFRTREGINRSDLSKAAGVADRTTRRIEDGEPSQQVTLYKLFNALNELRNKGRSENDYTFPDVFPNHKEA
jgi:DNA-binding XRE family transcriptional regulator